MYNLFDKTTILLYNSIVVKEKVQMNENGHTRNFILSLPLTTMGFITFIVFLILKVTGAWIDITWFWVFFPLWIGFATDLIIQLIIIIVVYIITYL